VTCDVQVTFPPNVTMINEAIFSEIRRTNIREVLLMVNKFVHEE